MKSFYLLLLTLIGALAFPHPYDGKVLILSPENFVIAQNEFRFILINFYDPDAISSQDSFQQEFALAAEKADKTYPGLRLAKMNVVLYKSFTQQFEPIDSSTAKLFIDGKNAFIEYNGRKDAEEIVAWLEDQIASRLIELEYSNELNQLIKEDKHVALYFGSRDTYEFAQYLGVSTLYKDYISFAYANEESIKQDFGLEDDSFTVFRNHNEEMSLLESPFSVENLQRFINTYTYPTVMNFDGTARTLIFNKKTDTVFLIRRSDSAGDDAEEAFRNLAESFRHHLAFIIGNVGEQNTELLIDLLGVDRNNLPTVMILHFSDNRKKYRLDSEPSEKNIKIFLLNFLEGNLVPFYKSAPLPDPDREYDGHVKIVVHDTYKEIVFDESKDVMVEFYSPKCGHCQAFAPIYESLAEKMENTKNLLLVKVDATVNDIEDVNPPGYPYVIFYPRDQKQIPIDFTGERKVENLITFIQQHATVKIDI